MNGILLKKMAVLLLLTGCVGQSNYEQAISDFLQTDKRGTWTDMQFKVIEMSDAVEITVADSVLILTNKFDADKSQRLASLDKSLARNKASLAKERFNSMKEFYQKQIDKNQLIVDSLAKVSVTLPDAYKDVSEKTVLAKEITCKFSIVSPILNARQEMTETFVLNPAGDKCYRMKSKRKK